MVTGTVLDIASNTFTGKFQYEINITRVAWIREWYSLHEIDSRIIRVITF